MPHGGERDRWSIPRPEIGESDDIRHIHHHSTMGRARKGIISMDGQPGRIRIRQYRRHHRMDQGARRRQLRIHALRMGDPPQPHVQPQR